MKGGLFMKYIVNLISDNNCSDIFKDIKGATLYDDQQRTFLQIESNELDRLAFSKQIRGIKPYIEGLELDGDGFNQQDYFIRYPDGSYEPYLNDKYDFRYENIFTLVRVIIKNNSMLYEIVSHRCKRYIVTESILIELSSTSLITGCFIEYGDIVPCKGIRLCYAAETSNSSSKKINDSLSIVKKHEKNKTKQLSIVKKHEKNKTKQLSIVKKSE